MADINTYANDRLIDFADAMHAEIATILAREFGDEWLSHGVRRHQIGPGAGASTRQSSHQIIDTAPAAAAP